MDNYSKTGAYWEREKSPNGRKINDALDKHEENKAWAGVARGTERQQEAFYELRREVMAEKAMWRRGLQETGVLVTPQDQWDREDRIAREQDANYNLGLSGEQVRAIKSSDWRISMDGREESQVHIGQSEKGFHYSVTSTDNRSYENDTPWSKPFKTMEAAEKVAQVEQSKTLGEFFGSQLRDPQREARREAAAFADQLPPTARASVANDLNLAALYRQEGHIANAKYYVETARQDRLAYLTPRAANHDHDIGFSR